VRASVDRRVREVEAALRGAVEQREEEFGARLRHESDTSMYSGGPFAHVCSMRVHRVAICAERVDRR
jgi:hypothetical protein